MSIAFQQFTVDFKEYLQDNKMTTNHFVNNKKYVPVGPYNISKADNIFRNKA